MSELHAVGTTREDAEGDVVFVHGLGGDWRGTWTADPSWLDGFWPQWLADDLPEVNVWSLAYEASPSGWVGTSMPLIDRATNVLTLLEAEGFGARPLIFVAHSLGGLLVKQMLRTGETLGDLRWRAIIRQVRGIAFLATPHSGARLADYMGALGSVLRASVSMRELEASTPAPRELNLWFRNNARAMRVVSLLFFETQNTRGVRVVDEASADPGLEGVVPRALDADHLTIAKPASRAAILPKLVRGFVGRCFVPPQQPDTPNGQPVPGAPVPSGSVGRGGVASWQLPSKPDRCFGREDDIATLVAAILESTPRPAIVLGGAGMGKTTLTLAAAAHTSVVERFGSRRCFVPLEQAQSVATLLAALHDGLGLPSERGPCSKRWKARWRRLRPSSCSITSKRLGSGSRSLQNS